MSTPTQTHSLIPLSVCWSGPRQRWLLRGLWASSFVLLLGDGGAVAEARTHRANKKGAGDAAVTAPAAPGHDAAGPEVTKAAAADSGSKASAANPASPPAATSPKPTTVAASTPTGRPAAGQPAQPGSKAGASANGATKPTGTAEGSDGKAAVASAPPKELQVSEPRQQAAREHFMRGVDLYTQGNYPNAWLEFSAAYQIVPLVDLLNNMARCEVRMGRPRDALDHFKRFIAARPNDQDAEYINQEIARLEGELGRKTNTTQVAEAAEAPASKPPPRVPVASIFAGAATIAAAVAGGVTLGLVNGRYNDLRAICATTGCPAEDVGVLERQSYAGYGLLAVAGVGAVVTGVLLSFELRRNKEAGLRQFSSLRIGAPLASFALPGRF
ncbi:MAG: hypothetical protein JNJ46_24270 [Myxococcales bacterium]|nr:hypothetical protein [Myxococcales bacterium]